MIRIRIKAEEANLLNRGKIITTKNGNTYKNLPLWFKEDGELEGVPIYKIYELNELPDELKEAIKEEKMEKRMKEEKSTREKKKRKKTWNW